MIRWQHAVIQAAAYCGLGMIQFDSPRKAALREEAQLGNDELIKLEDGQWRLRSVFEAGHASLGTNCIFPAAEGYSICAHETVASVGDQVRPICSSVS